MATTSANALSPTATDLVPFIPRLTLEWLRDEPERVVARGRGNRSPSSTSPGFTAMSERLSSLGRAGAEEVTEVMNATFAALLAVAYARGRRPAEVRRRRAPAALRRRGSRAPRCARGVRDAPHAARDRAAADVGRRGSAEDARRAPLGPLPVLPRRGLASRAPRHRPGRDANGRDGGRVRGGRDPRQRGDGARSSTPTRSARRRATGDCSARRPRSAARSSRCPTVEGIPLEVAVPAPLRAQLLEIGPLEGEHRHACDRVRPLLRNRRDHRARKGPRPPPMRSMRSSARSRPPRTSTA